MRQNAYQTVEEKKNNACSVKKKNDSMVKKTTLKFKNVNGIYFNIIYF